MRYIFVFILLLSSNVYADTPDFISTFISDQYIPSDTGMVSDTKSGELVDYIKIGTNNYYAVHWIYRVANYWEHRITLLSSESKSYIKNSTIKSKGSIKDIHVSDDVLILNELGYGKNTPRCCPDKVIISKYRIDSGKLIKVNKN